MSLFDGVRRLFGAHQVSAAHLAGYRRVGAQVLDLQDRVPPRGPARAYLVAARCLQLFADKLVEDAFADPAHLGTLPEVSAAQAEALYRQVPDLVTAARQEVLAPGGTRDVPLPIVLAGRVRTPEAAAVSHLRAMLRAAQAVTEFAEGEVGGAETGAGQAKALLAEAQTNRDSATYLVGGLVDASLPPESLAQADDYVWATLAYAMGSLQEQAVPGVLAGMDLDALIEGGSRTPRTQNLSGLERTMAAENRREMLEAERERAQRQWRREGEEFRRHEDEEHHEHHHHHHHDDWW